MMNGTITDYQASHTRYNHMIYRKCANSGIYLPSISLGLWHNFGRHDNFENIKEMILGSFDMGINHFDLANNYGSPPGSSEENFGKILNLYLKSYRDELIISSKAGYNMWEGPYGIGSSKKYLIASLDQSLKRMGLDYVDIFYSHRFDPDTPLDETMEALEQIVRQGKALYIGISSYSANKTLEAYHILKSRNIKCFVHQPSYSMFNRWIEKEKLLQVLTELQMGCIIFSPLAQGLLTDKYLNNIPQNSRAEKNQSFNKDLINKNTLGLISNLNNIARHRGQTLAQMAIAWVLRKKEITSALIGASNISQIRELVGALEHLNFSDEEIRLIDNYAIESNVNIWKESSQF